MNYLYQDLTYKIIGLIYDTFNNLGCGYQEKIYQKAFEEKLKKNNINFERELYYPIKSDDKIIGKYFVDFLIENQVVLEFKVANKISNKHICQILGYLKTNNIKLGLIVLFSKKVEIKRIIN